MLEPLLIGALLALLPLQHSLYQRQAKAERAHHSHRELALTRQVEETLRNVRELTNQIVLLKVKPEQAAAVALADGADTEERAYIPPFDDEALAEYENDRRAVTVE